MSIFFLFPIAVARVAERYKLMTEHYRGACELYNESADKMEPFEFFAYFTTFCTNFEKAREENHRRDAADYVVGNAKGLAPGQFPEEGSLLPKHHIRNDQMALPSHPVLGVTSKRS